MSKLVWDASGDRLYETGIDRVVLYPFAKSGNTKYAAGVAWNGVSAINESPSGAEASAIYADNIKYLNLMSVEELGLGIEAYTYPDEFAECDGSASIVDGVTIGQQTRRHFGISYRTLVGNDEESTDYGYKLHLVYDCMASPSEKSYATVNDSPEAISFSWDVTTTPVPVTGFKPTAMITIDSTKVNADKLTAIENLLYGTDGQSGTDASLPEPSALLTLLGVTGATGATS